MEENNLNNDNEVAVDYDEVQNNEIDIQQMIKTKNKFKSGANWLYWIAGLSLINTIIFIVGGEWNFVVGLGITQAIDAVAYIIATEFAINASNIIRIVATGINVLLAGVFVLFGYFANKRYNWGFVVGIILYSLDSILVIVAGDYVSFGFHIFALFFIFGGLKACKALKASEPKGEIIPEQA